MPLKISFQNDIKVFETGIVIQYNQEPITFELTGTNNDQNVVIVEVRFMTNTENTEASMTFENGGINHLIMNLVNFNDKINHGNADPLKIGTLENLELFFSYRVTSAIETFSRTFEYTFYTGKEVLNG